MGLLAAGLGAIEVLPTMEFKPFSNLAVLPYSHFLSNSVAPQTLVTLLFPYLMGADYVTYHPVGFFGPAQMVVTASYVGLLPLLFGVAALSFWRTSRVCPLRSVLGGRRYISRVCGVYPSGAAAVSLAGLQLLPRSSHQPNLPRLFGGDPGGLRQRQS